MRGIYIIIISEQFASADYQINTLKATGWTKPVTLGVGGEASIGIMWWAIHL